MARLLRTLGSFCARHGLLVIGIWALLGLGVGVAVATYGAQTNNDLSLPGTGSQAAKDLLEERFPPQQNGVNPIVFDVSTGKLTDDDDKQAVTDSVKAIAAVPARLQRDRPAQQRRPDRGAAGRRTARPPSRRCCSTSAPAT